MYKNLDHLDCYREETRESIVRNYNLKLLIYAKLLNDKTKYSDAHDTMKNKYYEFLCISKNDDNIVKAITCGSGAGEHLIKLANIKKPKIFNPLIENNTNVSGNNTDEHNNNANTWNPLAKELYNAIRWLIYCWDVIPYGKLLKIKEDLETYYYSEPHAWKIEFINNIVKNDTQSRKLTEMIDELRTHNNIKNYNFNLINAKLEEENIKSFF